MTLSNQSFTDSSSFRGTAVVDRSEHVDSENMMERNSFQSRGKKDLWKYDGGA